MKRSLRLNCACLKVCVGGMDSGNDDGIVLSSGEDSGVRSVDELEELVSAMAAATASDEHVAA